MKYEIFKYHPTLKSQVLKLQNHLWSQNTATNAAYLEWKYESNPYVDRPLIYVALYEEQIVAMRGFSGAKWEVGHPSQQFLVLCAGDLVVAPEHRSRGLFREIMDVAINDLAHQGHAYIFNMSASPTTYVGSLTMGWRSIGSLQVAQWQSGGRKVRSRIARYVRQRPFLSSGFDRVRAHLHRRPVSKTPEQHQPFSSLDKNAALRRAHTNSNVSVECAPRTHAMAELVGRIGGDGRIRHVRDQQYFAWRFQNPLSLYRFLFWEDNRLEGYLVLRASTRTHLRTVSIIDWEAMNPHVRSELLRAALRWGDFGMVEIWSATLADEVKILLRDTGFYPAEEVGSIGRAYRMDAVRPSILVRPVWPDKLKTSNWTLANYQLLDAASWDLRMIYSDAF